MVYIFLAAGAGSRLHPITLSHPKSLFKLDEELTVLQRMVNYIRRFDSQSQIIVVDGFQAEVLEGQVKGVTFIRNPFYAVTNSIASLWFARNELACDNAVIINGDIVMESRLIEEIVCRETDIPFVLLDGSVKRDGDYNVQIQGDKVLVMSKQLEGYFGEYAGITKLDGASLRKLMAKTESMIDRGYYDQWYENALVQMIFEDNFALYYKNIEKYTWTEVDCVNDLVLAKKIHENDGRQYGGL